MDNKKIKRTSAEIDGGKQLATYQEEEVLLNNSPMPSPQDLEYYKNIDHRLVDVFIDTWKDEQQQRHELAKRGIDLVSEENRRKDERTKRGMNFAFVAFLVFMGITAYALYLGNVWFAAFSGTISIGGVISAFMTPTKEKGQSD